MILKEWLYRLLCFICAFTILLSVTTMTAMADDNAGQRASAFAYTLNDAMLRYGVITTEERGGYIGIDRAAGIYPSGVIYADMIDFDNDQSPYLVIFRADPARGCVSADIYRYNEEDKKADLVNIISKGYNIGADMIGEMAIGYNDTERYLVYNEYRGGEKVRAEFFTIMDGTAFQYVSPPAYADEASVVSFNCDSLHPEVDVSAYNRYLGEFFAGLKDASADSVTYEDIADKVSLDEMGRIEKVLSEAAKLSVFDIGDYPTRESYDRALTKKSAENTLYSVTNLYDIGEQIYYVRFATDHSFYNYAMLRRTDAIEEGYQLLNVRCDSIPLSDTELTGLWNAYTHNRLVFKKARGSILEKNVPLFKHQDREPDTGDKMISADLRKSIGLIGGGVCLILFVIFWVYIGSDE